MSETASMCSRKRAREGVSSEDEGDEVPVPKPHATLWFEDGNIVLIAEAVAFKVHRGVLARQSAVFGDLFCIPQPDADAIEMMDGSPVVRVHDSAPDLAIFIEVLYDGFKYRRSESWPVLQSLLVLSQKYEAANIHAEAVFQLQLVFPMDLDGWDARLDRPRTGAIHTLYDPAKDCISAVCTARTLELPVLLSAALYDCCQLDALELVVGVIHEDGRRDQLMPEDQVFCVRARTRLMQLNHYLWNKVCKTPARRCQTPMSCDAARIVLQARINDPKEPEYYCIHPAVMSRAEWLEVFLGERGSCASCIKAARRSLNEARRVFLERLERLDFLSENGPS